MSLTPAIALTIVTRHETSNFQSAIKLYAPSKTVMDPYFDVIRLIGARAALFGAGIEAAGHWAVSFPKRDDLLFCWVESGECRLFRPGGEEHHLRQGDFVLIRTSCSFTLASDAISAAVDSAAKVSKNKTHRLRLGSGTDHPVVLHAGKFVINAGNALLMGMLPSIVHVAHGDPSSRGVRSLLAMNQTEFHSPGPGSEFVIVRLAELLLVEILRFSRGHFDQEELGLLAGLSDPVTSRALALMHGDVGHAWTVSALAKQCAVSRSAFAARFSSIVGIGPMEYLQRWRMALAKEALRAGASSVGDIAMSIGFQSASAFSTAFTKAVGCSPTRFHAREKRGASMTSQRGLTE